eukprot:SAG22_NODE_372_length_11551_cov_20.656741_13_plen_121_part_00
MAERKARRDGWGKIVDGFEPTGHAVLIVGYGVGENGTKYWRVKNCWGRHFGSSGYFRVRRGRDDIAIESTTVSADTRAASAAGGAARGQAVSGERCARGRRWECSLQQLDSAVRLPNNES